MNNAEKSTIKYESPDMNLGVLLNNPEGKFLAYDI